MPPVLPGSNNSIALGSYAGTNIQGQYSIAIGHFAGSEEQNPSMSTEDLVRLIKQAKRQPIERDTLYNIVEDFSNHTFQEA